MTSIKKAVTIMFAFALCFTLMMTWAHAGTKAKNGAKGPVIVERVIRVDGAFEKPKVIFIVPRSKIKKNKFYQKSFVSELLKPVYPKDLSLGENRISR